MKQISSKTQIYNDLLDALNELDTTDKLIECVRKSFKLAYVELPLLVPYEINLVEIESLRYSVFYQSGPEVSNYAIEIKGPKYCEYIWRDTGVWVLADEFFTPENIAENICKADLFTQMPESVRDLRFLLAHGYWGFIPEELPKFSGGRPRDSLEVLSWDMDYLLVGTTLENVDVVSRVEWDNISSREINWIQ